MEIPGPQRLDVSHACLTEEDSPPFSVWAGPTLGGGRLFLPVGQGSGVLEKSPGALIRWQQSQMSLEGWAGVDKSLPFTVDTAGEAWEAPSSPGVAWALSLPTVPGHGMPSDGGWRSPRIVNHVERYFWGQGEVCR